MSFNYLETPFYDIPELKESRLEIYDKLIVIPPLDKYLHLIIIEWNRDYPIPPLPNNILVLEVRCNYKFPLDNLPSTIEILSLDYTYQFPLPNLPINLYQFQFDPLSFYKNIQTKYINNNSFERLPESLKMLNITYVINQSSYNLPIGLKSLQFSSETFNDDIMCYPPTLEYICAGYYNEHIYEFESRTSKQLDTYFNFINLPLSLKTLELPEYNISNLENIIARLIHLEELHIPYSFSDQIHKYPPNLINLYFESIFSYKLVNLPASLKYLCIPFYNDSLEAVAASNIEHLDLYENQNISIINYLPKSLKKITIIETHFELSKIKQQYPHIEIIKVIDSDYQEELIKLNY